MSLKWIEIFKTGKHTSSNGFQKDYSVEELDQVVTTYNPSTFKAPLIVSYPAHNTAGYSDGELHKSQLAFGFPDQLKRVGDRLLAGFKKISPKVREWINDGAILGFSSSFYLPNSPHNPYPGNLALRHVAACGIDPPAVKGMQIPELAEPLSAFASYAENQAGAVEFAIEADEQTLEDAQLGAKVYRALKAVDHSVASFGDCAPLAGVMRQIFQQMRDRAIEEMGLEEADKAYPSYLLEQLSVISSQPYSPSVNWDDFMRLGQRVDAISMRMHEESESESDEYQEGRNDEVSNELRQQFSELQKQNDLLKQQLGVIQQQREVDRITSFVDGLVRDRKLLPSERNTEIKDILTFDHTETVDYGEAGQMTQRDRYMAKLESRKPFFSDKRLPIGPNDAPGHSEFQLDFAVPDGCELDGDSMKQYNAAVAYCEKQGWDPTNSQQLLKAVELTNGRN